MGAILQSLRDARSDPRRWLMGHRDGGLRLVRASLAAAVAWFISERVLNDGTPVLAPLTAVLTVQVTLYRTMTTALQRAAGVIIGVLLALFVVRWLGLHSWTIGLVTGLALMVGALLKLRSQAEEVAVSALLVLAVGWDPRYAEARVIETLLGAGVGIVANFLVVPSVYVRSADRSLAGLAATAADLLTEMGRGLDSGWTIDQAKAWLARARDLGGLASESRDALGRAEESLRYNPRRHRAPGSLEHLHEGKSGLGHATHEVRTVARTLADIAATYPDGPIGHAGLAPEFSGFLAAAGEAMRCYGQALSDPLAPGGGDRVAALRESLVGARRQHQQAGAAMRALPDDESMTWSVNGSLLAAGARILREIDPDEGLHVGALRPAAPPPALQVLRPPAEVALHPVRKYREAAPLRIRQRGRKNHRPDA